MEFLRKNCGSEIPKFLLCAVWKMGNSLPCHAFFSSNQFRVKFFSKKLHSRNFCEKMAVKFTK